jgi:hypothetical protein
LAALIDNHDLSFLMSTAPRHPCTPAQATLDEVVGYLNFSSGASDPKFLRNVNALFRQAETSCRNEVLPVAVLCRWLQQRIDELPGEAAAFGDVSQARALVPLLQDRLLPAYRKFHRDLLWHQSNGDLWRPLFLGRAWEALLAQGSPWEETDRIVAGALDAMNNYIGYRPVAVVESERQMEPYAHEWLAPIPLYIQDVGVAAGPYERLIEHALGILTTTSAEILQQAWFDPQLLAELALDPRAYEFDHPASKRPNHHFGQWDPNSVDNRGYYRRFVLQQITLDALLARINDDLLFEAAAVLAGTILMASGTSGNGPGCHSSDVALSNLLPHIAAYRDHFYEELLAGTEGPLGERLRVESRRTKQPFGGARQHLNHELARRRAAQMQHVQLAQLYARMGYADAALAEAHAVKTASARMLCQIYCRLTAGHQAIDARQLDAVAVHLPEIEDLLERGIECGALVDPWNIIGFGGNFSLFPSLENSVHDFRVDDMIELVEQILDLCARARTEAAAIDDSRQEAFFSAALERLAGWWDKYAAATVSDVKRLVGKEIEVSTNLVAGALSAWHKAGAEAGNVRFWRMFVDQFDSPKAFQLVVEALLDRGDQVASMALMLQWISQVDRTPLDDGDVSFHPLALRWLRSVEQHERAGGESQWPLVAKFFARLEASADTYWHAPTFELAGNRAGAESDDGDGGVEGDVEDPPSDPDADAEGTDEAEFEGDQSDSHDDIGNGLYSAAYENMVYRDSTDDGFDSEVMDESAGGSEFELEQEAQRLGRRLEFLGTVARLWRHAAIAWNADDGGRQSERESFATWCRQASAQYKQLLNLLVAVHRYRIPQPSGSHDSMVEFNRRRMVKESLLEQIISTCVDTADAGRLLCAAGQVADSFGDGSDGSYEAAPTNILQGVLAGNVDLVREHWPTFTEWLSQQELLYVQLSRGGRPRRIVKARALAQLLHDLLEWLPRLGLIRETCRLLDLAQTIEAEHPVGPGAVTEFDRLFTSGYQAMVRCLVASANDWGCTKSCERSHDHARPIDDQSHSSFVIRHSSFFPASDSDTMLVDALKELTESQLSRWLTHSRTLRLSIVERLTPDEWPAFVAFIERYGADLFTQKFLNLGNLQAILHQRTAVWLSNLELDDESEELKLMQEMGQQVSREEAAKWLTIALEAVVENYREYRDYNTTTTHSDHGDMLYTLIDFLRLRVAYDRMAWNLRPVIIAHEILVRHDRPGAAEMWQQALAEQTTDAADANLARFDELCEQYGIRLASVAERLAERFVRPLAIDRVQALVAPAIDAAGSGDPAPFAALQQEIASLAQEPAGAGLDLPDWLEALEEEVSLVRCKRRHRQPNDNVLRRIEQAKLSWEDWQRQIGEEIEE